MIIYGGTKRQIDQQLACTHLWSEAAIDNVSRYKKCVKCLCLYRDCSSEDEYYRLLKESKPTITRELSGENTEANKRKPMRCDIDWDWCTYYCPCGDSLCTRFLSDYECKVWEDRHRPHTNGRCVQHTNANGQRAWGGPVPDEEREF